MITEGLVLKRMQKCLFGNIFDFEKPVCRLSKVILEVFSTFVSHLVPQCLQMFTSFKDFYFV